MVESSLQSSHAESALSVDAPTHWLDTNGYAHAASQLAQLPYERRNGGCETTFSCLPARCSLLAPPPPNDDLEWCCQLPPRLPPTLAASIVEKLSKTNHLNLSVHIPDWPSCGECLHEFRCVLKLLRCRRCQRISRRCGDHFSCIAHIFEEIF